MLTAPSRPTRLRHANVSIGHTDHVVVLQTQATGDFQRLTERMAHHSATDYFVSIVTFHEQMLGWNAYISRANRTAGVTRGYERMHDLLVYFRDAQVLLFDQAAGNEFDALRGNRIRIATMDLRIAAIALSRGMTVLTRDLSHFQRVPNLQVEDWTAE